MIIILFITFLLISLLLLVVIFKFIYLKVSSNVCLIGKTAVVTGGSLGIGYEIVLQLASRGCKVIIADKIVNEDIKNTIINETDNKNISLEYVDFASFKSVRKFAKKLNESEEKLDILINNVGMGKCTETLTEDGLNMTMQVNYYSTFLLTHLLVDLLKKSKQGKILFTSSGLSYMHLLFPKSVTSHNIKNPSAILRMFDYPNSKFCVVTSARIFAEKLEKWNITSNVYHPGIVKTPIWNTLKGNINNRNISEVTSIFILQNVLLTLAGISSRDATQTAIELVLSKKFANVSGIFFGKYFPNLLPRGCNDVIFCKRIWEASEKMCLLTLEEKLK